MYNDYLASKIDMDMTNMGICEYTVEPVYYKNFLATQQEVDTKNAWYYLNTNPNFTTLLVIGEDNQFSVVPVGSPQANVYPTVVDFNTMQSYQYPSFKGKLLILQNPGINIEFLAVTPLLRRTPPQKPTFLKQLFTLLKREANE